MVEVAWFAAAVVPLLLRNGGFVSWLLGETFVCLPASRIDWLRRSLEIEAGNR